jgi:hypothetical protein
MKPFTDTLAQLRYGKAAEELTEAMATLIAKCTETGGKGSITLKLSIAPGKSGQVEIVDTITSKLPEFTRSTSLFFVTPEGNLSRNDPRQGELPGVRRVVDAETGEIMARADAA